MNNLNLVIFYNKRFTNTISNLKSENYIFLMIYPNLKNNAFAIRSYIPSLKNSTLVTRFYIFFPTISDLKFINYITH